VLDPITILLDPDKTVLRELQAAIADGLSQHAAALAPGTTFRPLTATVGQAGALRGAATGILNWNWLFVSLLWVAPEARGRGLGRSLLRALETTAQEQGCTMAHVDTFSFQAPDFYRRAGYEVFGTLEAYPQGHTRYFLRKAL